MGLPVERLVVCEGRLRQLICVCGCACMPVERLGQKLKAGELKDIVAIPTSIRTKEQAESLGIPLVTLDTHSGECMLIGRWPMPSRKQADPRVPLTLRQLMGCGWVG